MKPGDVLVEDYMLNDVNSDDEWELESILDERELDGAWQYRIKWTVSCLGSINTQSRGCRLWVAQLSAVGRVWLIHEVDLGLLYGERVRATGGCAPLYGVPLGT